MYMSTILFDTLTSCLMLGRDEYLTLPEGYKAEDERYATSAQMLGEYSPFQKSPTNIFVRVRCLIQSARHEQGEITYQRP
jgi:hypothetical protein